MSCEPLLEEIKLASDTKIDWVIIGAQTGPGGKQPEKTWVDKLTRQTEEMGSAIFYKPNLVWQNPPHEFPSP